MLSLDNNINFRRIIYLTNIQVKRGTPENGAIKKDHRREIVKIILLLEYWKDEEWIAILVGTVYVGKIGIGALEIFMTLKGLFLF